jgi:pyruvate/2-oxoglutarate/acetoin dehydrogenase E1 component
MSETYLESIRCGLLEAMDAADNVLLLGEDIVDPYGGAFKATRGLSTRFPGRVIATPVSEAAIIGVCTGLALRGFRPVAEIMFGDFITLATDQLVNTAAKFPLMYRGKVTVPMLVRTPMGGGRGYGPTHSQSLEKMFFGVPGLRVVSPSVVHDPGALLKHCILNEQQPILFVEYKTLYSRTLLRQGDFLQVRVRDEGSGFPVAIVENFTGAVPDVVIVSYGGVAASVLSVMSELVEEEIRVRALVPTMINRPLSTGVVVEFISGAEPIIIAEMGTELFNWGSEIAAQIYERLFGRITAPITRLAAADDVIPAAKQLENMVLPTEEKIHDAILRCLS